MPATSLPKRLSLVELLARDTLIERGGSAIIAPDGRYVAGPVFDQETILHACLDLTEIERESMTLDVSGHYSRPDLFRFSVAEEKRE
jgi:nitrilase